jgi:hypothetical protein
MGQLPGCSSCIGHDRRFWYENYDWMTTTALVIAVWSCFTWVEAKDRYTLIATVTGAALGIFYFFQKQMLDESQLFEKLFTGFNERYGKIQPKLGRIHSGHLKDPEELEAVLNEYFNLCAEEYLFYVEGRIHPRTWQAWCHGMLLQLRNPVIGGHWVKLVKPESHYGITREEIEAGTDPYRDEPPFIRDFNRLKRSIFAPEPQVPEVRPAHLGGDAEARMVGTSVRGGS